ncbi:MAG: DKNYY domain-containing protein [Flavobacteriales bacterium]|nr:DKNYY domain-containing protein [Flavobacteriales bacterium]MBK8948673.1 DKNYY domain-containing protein [Flavobacteriales bacterium]
MATCSSNCTRNGDAHGRLPEGFRRSGDSILYHNMVLDGVDAGSFQVLDASFCKDSGRVFHFDSYRESRDYFLTKKHVIDRLDRADAASFQVLGHAYAKDDRQAWYRDQPFRVKDLRSLQALSPRIVKDDTSAYLDRKPIPGSHGRSFALIDHTYARDTLHRFYIQGSGNEVAVAAIPCDPPTFRILDHTYAVDRAHVFHQGRRIPGALPEGFVLLGSGYARDGRSVFFRGRHVAGADPATFTLFAENERSSGEVLYAQDTGHIYVNDMPFEGVDRATFRILDEKYTVDINGVYFRMQRVHGADPLTFKVYPHYLGEADAEDKDHRYGDGNVVE